MSYRGRDLDLRTPERAHYLHEPVDSDARAASTGTLIVDETVLACFNHGYDLSLAHRAREVRIEHLLNAMTRTDAAISVLTAHGIDVSGLRHDSASLIASDETSIPGSERLSPRRSQLLADVLQSAADRARKRNSAVTIVDLLRVLLELNSEQSGVVMLKRNAPGWQPRVGVEPLRAEPLPPLMGGNYQADARYVAAEPPREWVRVPAPQSGYYTAPQPQTYYVAEPSVAMPQAAGSIADVVQNSRLDQLERTIRDLSSELASERQAFSQLVGEMRRDFSGHTDSNTRLRGGLDERLVAIERNVEAKFGELARGWTILGERLQGLELAVNADRGEGAMPSALVDRLQGIDSLGTTLTTISDRMTAMERRISQPSAVAPEVDLMPIMELLEGLETTVAKRTPSPVDLTPVLDRLQVLEARIADINRGATGIADRVGQFERRLEASSGIADRVLAQTGDRLRAIEDALLAQRSQVTQLATSLGAEVRAVSQGVAAQNGSGERIQALVGERFQGLSAAIERSRSEIGTAVAQPLTARISEISLLVETHRSEAAQIVADMGERIGTLEKVIQGFGQRTLDLHAAHGADLVELHNALVKLNSNQQTLAASMDQWRLDNGNELSALLTRLDGVERANAKPLQMLETLQTNVQSLQRFTARREEQRSRFKHWLMGTDDWYAASWENGHAGTTASVPGKRTT